MIVVRWLRYLALGTGGLLMSAAAQAPRDPLAAVETGRWSLHEIGTRDPARFVCVTDPRALLQVQHQGAICNRFPFETGEARVSARYSCPGAGYGQTSITIENPRLVRIETQGIAGGQPFEVDYEARRVGACG